MSPIGCPSERGKWWHCCTIHHPWQSIQPNQLSNIDHWGSGLASRNGIPRSERASCWFRRLNLCLSDKREGCRLNKLRNRRICDPTLIPKKQKKCTTFEEYEGVITSSIRYGVLDVSNPDVNAFGLNRQHQQDGSSDEDQPAMLQITHFDHWMEIGLAAKG